MERMTCNMYALAVKIIYINVNMIIQAICFK